MASPATHREGLPIRVIACAAVAPELRACLPPDVAVEVVDMELHERPAALREAVQERIDAAAGAGGTVIVGMGLCSQAAVGLEARDAPLVLPRVDDCIGFLLGRCSGEPATAAGTYYLTRGWIDAGVATPFSEYERFAARWGTRRADRLVAALLRHYTHLAFVKTGSESTLGPYRRKAQEIAERFHLEYVEVEGSDLLLKRLLGGGCDRPEVITVEPGCPVALGDYYDDYET